MAENKDKEPEKTEQETLKENENSFFISYWTLGHRFENTVVKFKGEIRTQEDIVDIENHIAQIHNRASVVLLNWIKLEDRE